MSILSRAFARGAKLPPPISRDVTVERDLEAKMPDGAILRADRWYSPARTGSDPVILIRTPYGRRQFALFGEVFAGRGYQVVLQSTRGTFGSGGRFEPFHSEKEDGLATLEWVSSQPWFTGSIFTYGPSYMGITQWAMGQDPPEYLKAMALQVTAADFRSTVVYPSGSFSLETGSVWVGLVNSQERTGWRLVRSLLTLPRRAGRACDTLPLAQADVAAEGHRIDYYQDWLAHEQPGDPWWAPLDFTRHVRTMPPASLVAGWYDIFLKGQVDDFRRLRDAGREARLTIGPWTHMSPGGSYAGVHDALEWFGQHSAGGPGTPTRDRVRIFVMGSDRWVDLPDWPPPHSRETWMLQAGFGLSPSQPSPAEPDRYVHDPAEPAPGLGGATLHPLRAGAKNQRLRESRPDVLVYTSAALDAPVTLAGPLEATVFIQSTVQHFDVFARLCDVDEKGKSWNVSDGLLRIEPDLAESDGISTGSDGVVRVQIRMAPCARTFPAGHRLRLQISSAAHPLFARNTGSGEPLATATRLVRSRQDVFHDPDHPSALILPVSPI